MTFADTSVITASSTPTDIRHIACVRALENAEPRGLACALHTLAELYSVLSGRPHPVKMPPAVSAQIVDHTRRRFKIITLTISEYFEAIAALPARGQTGGMVYDALLMACARKVKATRIYTLNPKHFKLIAPDLAARIVEP